MVDFGDVFVAVFQRTHHHIHHSNFCCLRIKVNPIQVTL